MGKLHKPCCHPCRHASNLIGDEAMMPPMLHDAPNKLEGKIAYGRQLLAGNIFAGSSGASIQVNTPTRKQANNQTNTHKQTWTLCVCVCVCVCVSPTCAHTICTEQHKDAMYTRRAHVALCASTVGTAGIVGALLALSRDVRQNLSPSKCTLENTMSCGQSRLHACIDFRKDPSISETPAYGCVHAVYY